MKTCIVSLYAVVCFVVSQNKLFTVIFFHGFDVTVEAILIS